MSDRQLDHNSGSDNLHLTSGESDSSQPEKHNSFLAEFSQSSPSDIKKVQAGPDAGIDAETMERFKEFLKSFGVNPEAEANERPAEPKDLAPNPGRQAFDKTYNDLEAENIKSFRTKQPDFRKVLEMADKHLVDAANNYVLEGYTSERFDKITTLGGAALFPNYRTRPLTLSYTGRFQKQWGQWGYNLEYAHNLSSGGGNDDAAYGANRAGASTSWNALRYGFDVAFPLPAQWLFMARLRGQDSGDALVPGEQFGIGGALSLRGLPERVLSGDSGHWGNLEFWTPALAENLRMLVFYDFGRIRRHNDATLPSASVSSFGLGVRWSMGKQLSASLDLGHVLSGRSKLPAGTSRDRAHLNVSYQF